MTQMTKTYFLYIFGLYLQLLTHSSPNPGNFLSVESYKGASFVVLMRWLSESI